MSGHTLRRAASALAIILALVVAPSPASASAPAPDAGGGDTAPATASETVPATAPVTVTTPGSIAPDDGGDDDDIPWPLIIAGGAAVIALVALLAALSRRKPRPTGTSIRSTTGTPARHDQTAQERGYALGSAQWVHDNFTLELLAASPEVARRRWTTDRPRLDDATIRAQRFSTEPDHGLAWQSLAQSLSLLGSSMETLIELRNAEAPDQQLIHEASEVVQRHRAQLATDIATLWPTLQR
jgi:hypothetical protein